jgi:hypothetical protein
MSITAKMENWRAIPNYALYEVSNLGRVRSWRGYAGHLYVALYKEPRKGDRFYIHRLVLTTFERKPTPGENALHRDGDPSKNQLSNLYWGTQADNLADAMRHGTTRRGTTAPHHKLIESDVRAIRTRLSEGDKQIDIARDFGVAQGTINCIKSSRSWGWLL